MPQKKFLAGQVALVTGAGVRVGRAIALALAEHGATVAVHYNDSADEAKRVAALIRRKGGKGDLFQADLSDDGQRVALFQEIQRTLGSDPIHHMPLWVWRLGQAALVAIPNEAYSTLQTTLRQQFADVPLFVLGVTNGTLVEAVALELETVEPEVAEQVALQLPRRLVGDPVAAEIRVCREAAEIRDPAAPVRQVEPHRAGPLPLAPVRGLDHEAAALERLPLRALDLLQHGFPVARPACRHERHHVRVAGEHEQAVEIVRCRPADTDVHSGTAAGRRVQEMNPEPNATPPRMRTSPISFCAVSDSFRSVVPYTSANGGRR